MNRFQKYREIMELRNPTDQPNAVNNRAALNAKNDPFKMYGPDGFKPSSTAADRMTPDMQQSMLNKFLSSRAVELATDYDARQLALTGAGMTPAVGIGADLAAAIDSLVNLKLGDLAMNVGAMVPGAGQAVGGAKLSAAGLGLGLSKIRRAPGRVDDAANIGQGAQRAGRDYVGPSVPDVEPRVPDVAGQQKMPGFGKRSQKDKAGESRVGRRQDVTRETDSASRATDPNLPRKADPIDPAELRGLRMDPTPGRARVETGTTTRTTPEVTPARQVEVDVAPGRGMTAKEKAAAALLAAGGTSLLLRPLTRTRTDTDPKKQEREKKDPIGPSTDTKTPIDPTKDPRRDDQFIDYPEQEAKKDKAVATRLVSPRGFREDVSFGDIVASLMENRSSRSTGAGSASGSKDILDKLPKGTKSVLGGILATVLGLGLAGGLGQRGSGSASAGDVIGGLTDASLIVGSGGLEKLKALAGYDPNIMPGMAGAQAVTSR